jgi:hypothetical protein
MQALLCGTEGTNPGSTAARTRCLHAARGEKQRQEHKSAMFKQQC